MTLISLADCCRRLYIDPKTLHHWLSLAQISVQPHPLDARLKCVTQQQLEQVAAAHHRALSVSVPPQTSADASPTNGMCASVLSDFVAQTMRLTEQLASLQTHVATLQNQLTRLSEQTHLEQAGRASASQASGEKSQKSSQEKSEESSQQKSQKSSQEKSEESSQQKSQKSSQEKSEESSQQKSQKSSQEKSRQSSQQKSQQPSQEESEESSQQKSQEEATDAPTPSVSIDRRKHPRVLPLVEYVTQGTYVVISPELGRLECSPDSPEWFTWLSTLPSFRFVGQHGHFTAFRGYQCSSSTPWWAHRQIRNHSHKRRLGPTDQVTVASLELAATSLQALV
ncbi:MAG: hypothetical protein E6J34_19080 [Chloroflexi bacterium]|nr:MAG: hypothetical protein E6J34_19080 [Chloroflexota bacterium]